MSGIYRGPNGSATADALNIDGDKGDLTISNSGLEWTINPDAVDFSKMQNISTDVLLGRATSGSGNIEEITCTAAGRALLDDVNATAQRTTLGLGNAATATIGTDVLAFDSNLQGFIDTFTLPTTDATNGFVLTTNGAGTLSLTAPGGIPDGDKGDIVVSSGGTVWAVDTDAITTSKILDDSVTYAKIQNVSATDKLLGRSSSGAGNIEEITCTSAGRALLDDVDASTQRTTLGLGSIATLNSISNPNITANTIALDKLAREGTVGQVLTSNGTGADASYTNIPKASEAEYITGTDNNKFLTSQVARNQNIVLGTAVATTSGTAFDFTGIPSWAKRITVMFSGISKNSTSNYIIQLGDSGGIETTGYSGSMSVYSTSAVTTSQTDANGHTVVFQSAASESFGGQLVITLQDSTTNTWQLRGTAYRTGASILFLSSGNKSTSGTLDRVRITSANGTDLFDAGTINILYE